MLKQTVYLALDANLLHLGGRLQAELHSPRVADERDVLARSLDLRLADRHDEVGRERLGRHRKRHAVHDLVFQADHWTTKDTHTQLIVENDQ